LWTDLPWRSQASYWLQYDCQSSIVSEPCMADYAVIASPHSMPALSQFRVCDGDSIATATTLIVQVPGFYPIFENCNSRRLRSTPVPSFPAGLPDDFWAQRLSLMRSDPRGLDIMFTHGRQMMFLPGNARIAY
jgi:alpha-D-ribose 1-methylphosphonate 5-triphosphate synthase subunit PhnH